jgi:exonuclease SbcC
MEENSRQLSLAQADLARARQRESELAGLVEMRRQELELEAERRRHHDLLAERISRLESGILERQSTVGAEEARLREIEVSRGQLAELSPSLDRLALVKARLDELEPKRKEHDGLLQRLNEVRAELQAEGRALLDQEQRLASLLEERSALKEARPRELEHQALLAELKEMDALRERHKDLESLIQVDETRLGSTEAGMRRLEGEIKGLEEARSRLGELLPRVEEQKALQLEVEEASRQRERQRERDSLLDRLADLQERSRRLVGPADSVREELSALRDLDAMEGALREQDREMDALSSELQSRMGELKSELKLQETRRREALGSLTRMKGLGAKSSCPTCERPLGEQYSILLERYELAASQAEGSMAVLEREIQAQAEGFNGVIRARSGLKRAFDDLNAKKSRRAELHASLRSLEDQLRQIAPESEGVERALETLGPVRFDPARFAEVQEALEMLKPCLEEHRSLSIRLEELPGKEKELLAKREEHRRLAEGAAELRRKVEEMGYDGAEHLAKKKRLIELQALHERFVLLSQRVQEIPGLEEAISSIKAELERLGAAAAGLQRARRELGFDPAKHESLVGERRSLARIEERAQELRIKIANEPEARQRLEEARAAMARLESELKEETEKLKILGYREEGYSAAKQALAGAEEGLEATRRERSERQVRLGVLESEQERLRREAEKKREHEEEISAIDRRLLVVENTRGLVNRFMDQVLIRIRDEIAKEAGRILDEVTGKYSSLMIDDDFNILVEDGGAFYPISRYSGGEMDMIAVSVRVAISEYLMRLGREGPGCSFLILDEVFGSQDVEHREKMINMLRGLDERFPQIFAISHISDVQGQFDNTISVIEDELGNSRVEVS